MKSLFGRGQSTTRKRSGTGRKFRFGAVGAAVSASLVASLAFSVSAVAATTVTTGTDSPITSSGWAPAPTGYTAPANDGLGVAPGKVGHVWVIVLENKAYNASFTPLEGTQNSYLSQLPSQGALLTNYYGTGHSSLDNYLSMVSGQAPQADDQDDCPGYLQMGGGPDMSGSLQTNPNYGQEVSAAGADAPAGDNGCVYPSSVPTVFNQLNTANKTWKVYAQDLGNADNVAGTSFTHDAGTQYCGAADTNVGPTPNSTDGADDSAYPNPSSADATDQYVAKHNPLSWFDSLLPGSMGGTGGGDCTQTLAPLFGANDQLYSDLQSESTTPDFSYIVPNNCSNGHDAVCAGNNLSGGFENNGQGKEGQVPSSTPTNYTGGTYSESLFLQHIVPEIEASPAFKDNGLIVVTYDESYPPFTWQNSFANSTLLPSDAQGSLTTDEAGETLYGRSLNWEPTGPNATLVTSATGQALTPGPGYNENIERPKVADGRIVGCTDGTTANPNGWVPFTTPTGTNGQCIPGSASTVNGTYSSSSATVTITAGSSAVSDPSATLKTEGQQVTLPAGTAYVDNGTSYTAGTNDVAGGLYVGDVADTAQNATAGGSVDVGSFTLVDQNGNPVTVTSGLSAQSITLQTLDQENDPFFDAYDETTGGGDAGAVLISPDITPGTVSNTYYNHYSLLRSIEDIFGTTGGLDGTGHIGYAAQPGLSPFGSDVFTNAETPAGATTVTTTITTPGTPTPGATVTKTTTTPPMTTTIPGATTTVSHTVSKTTTYALIPNIVGESEAAAKKDLAKDKLKLGKVTKPKGKLKKGDELVVGKAKPGVASREKTGSKVAIELKAIAKTK